METFMVDILVRNLDEDTARRLKEKAKARGTSVNETAREALAAYVRPSKAEAWAAIDAFRKKIGPIKGDSVKDIREDRDNDERYR
jgi:plasmid stability protein